MVKKLLATKTVVELVIWLVIFFGIGAIVGTVFGIFHSVPLVGWVLTIASSVIGLLCLTGAILAIVGFVKHHL